MGKKKLSHEEETTVVELNEDDMVDFDDIESEEEIEEESALDDELVELIQAEVLKSKKQAMAYTDKRLEKVNAKLIDHSKLFELQSDKIDNLEKVVEAMAQGKVGVVTSDGQTVLPKKKGNVLDVALGAVGGVAHTVVDTAAFICESVVDIATLGRARKPQ